MCERCPGDEERPGKEKSGRGAAKSSCRFCKEGIARGALPRDGTKEREDGL